MSPAGAIPEVDIDSLIHELAPLNNAYRAAVRNGAASGPDLLEKMWDAGEALRRAGVEKPDPVAWAIYGKPGEPRRSYITRDFACSCFRVRRYFALKGDIQRDFPGLQRHNLFKIALPLLDNEKYALRGEARDALIRLLNSGEAPSEIKRKIVEMKRARIAPRPARRSDVHHIDKAAGQVAARHAELVEINATRNRRRLRSLRKRVGDDNLLFLSKICLNLFSDEFTAPDTPHDPGIQGLWRQFYCAVAPITAAGPAERRRLRKRTGPMVLIEMAEMLSAARNGEFVVSGGRS